MKDGPPRPAMEWTQAMRNILLIDFGSTFTKITVVDQVGRRVVHSACVPSSVRTDACVCLEQCLDSARAVIGAVAVDKAVKLSSSSAAGGLRMAVIGLSHTLSATAGRNAAFGAGAKILGTFVGELRPQDIQDLERLNAEIILFCGGYENGCVAPLLHNAEMLSEGSINAPVIFAGNSRAAQAVRAILQRRNKECFVVDNIIPDVGRLNVGPTERIVRDVFMTRIVNMKGLDKVKHRLGEVLMPTPTAVLEAGMLLSTGLPGNEGLGPLMIVDVGGATTDIHTYVEQSAFEGARLLGALEPYARRTVEADMGVRESSGSLADEIGRNNMAERLGIPIGLFLAAIEKRLGDTKYVPDNEWERRIDQALASGAVHVAARRHAGRIEYVHSCNCTALQRGKNIRPVRTIIGTGGPLINSKEPRRALENVLPISQKDATILLPAAEEFYLDKRYIFYAAGLLKSYDADLALDIMKTSLAAI